ncbi:MAG: AAA family ATPase [Planctomycetaceae bacterium]
MSLGITKLAVKNYRSLAQLELNLGPINVFFGPNGSGKTTILDTIWFFRDCAIRGVGLATSERDHGIGILWDQADEREQIELCLTISELSYELKFGLSAGRIEPFAAELLKTVNGDRVLIQRRLGTCKAQHFHANINQTVEANLREPDKLSLGLYLDFNQQMDSAAASLDRLLHSVRFFHSRSFYLHKLKTQGSEGGPEIRLRDRVENAWSVLRNLHDRKSVDTRYDTIMDYMTQAFPSFDGLLLEQTGLNSVYASFRERMRRKEIRASGVSDGHLQLLLLLTALFSEGPGREAVILFDEPEISLHPWALTIFAKAVQDAAENWRKQVLIATHSPVLLSQFEIGDVLASQVVDGRTQVTRLSEMEEVRDLLEQYAAGSLYMSEAIAAQSGSMGGEQ